MKRHIKNFLILLVSCNVFILSCKKDNIPCRLTIVESGTLTSYYSYSQDKLTSVIVSTQSESEWQKDEFFYQGIKLDEVKHYSHGFHDKTNKYIYNSDDFLIGRIEYSPAYDLLRYYEYIINTEGTVTQRDWYTSDSILVENTFYTRDNYQNITLLKAYNDSGNLNREIQYEYNSNKNPYLTRNSLDKITGENHLVSKQSLDGNGNVYLSNSYIEECSYNSKGFPVSCIRTKNNGDTISVNYNYDCN